MRLQTDQEFKLQKIYYLNKKFNVDMFTTSLRRGKAFAAEQKIREFKKALLRSKKMEKYNKKRIKPNDLIKKATFNLNNVKSVKYGFAPEQIEEKSLNKETGKEFTEIYDFHRLIKVKENKDRIQTHNLKIDSRKKCLRSLLEIGEKVFVLLEHLKKKDAPGKFYKYSTENETFLIETIFTIVNRSKINDQGFIYWIKESDKKINGRFLRQELYALNNQFVE